MLVVKQEFFSFTEAMAFLSKLGNAIDTPYLSFAGDDIASFISSYTKIQLNRRFSPYIGGIDLELYFSQADLQLRYVSTSGTCVCLACKFDDDMQVSKCEITVDIDNSRCKPGRCHYEAITRMVYEHEWLKVIRDEKAKVRITGGARMIEGNLLPVPNWLLSQRSNFEADVCLSRELEKYGYSESNSMFANKTFTNGGVSLVIENYSPSWKEDRFQIVCPNERQFPKYWMSFRDLLLALKQASRKTDEIIDEYTEE